MRRAPAPVARWLVAVAALTSVMTWSSRPVAGAGRTDLPDPSVDLPGGWSAATRAAVLTALSRLPRAIRAGGPRAIVADGIACDAEGWPDDAQLIDGADRVHLCPSAAAAPEAIARQAAVAWLLAFDRAAGWSADAAWRRLNGWHTSVTSGWALRPENDDPAGFAAPRGRRSPAWDLATFMAAWLLDARGDDQGIGCRLISQARFISGRWAPTPPRPNSAERSRDGPRSTAWTASRWSWRRPRRP